MKVENDKHRTRLCSQSLGYVRCQDRLSKHLRHALVRPYWDSLGYDCSTLHNPDGTKLLSVFDNVLRGVYLERAENMTNERLKPGITNCYSAAVGIARSTDVHRTKAQDSPRTVLSNTEYIARVLSGLLRCSVSLAVGESRRIRLATIFSRGLCSPIVRLRRSCAMNLR